MKKIFLLLALLYPYHAYPAAAQSDKYTPDEPMEHYKTTQLQFAAARNDIAYAKQLLNAGADINQPNAFKKTALMHAVYPVFAINKSGYNDQGMADLHGAFERHPTEFGSPEMVTFLLNNGANIDMQDDKGRTALMHAVTSEQPDIVSRLLQHKPDLTVQDKNGKTVFELNTYRRWPLKGTKKEQAARNRQKIVDMLAAAQKGTFKPLPATPAAQQVEGEQKRSQPAASSSGTSLQGELDTAREQLRQAQDRIRSLEQEVQQLKARLAECEPGSEQ